MTTIDWTKCELFLVPDKAGSMKDLSKNNFTASSTGAYKPALIAGGINNLSQMQFTAPQHLQIADNSALRSANITVVMFMKIRNFNVGWDYFLAKTTNQLDGYAFHDLRENTVNFWVNRWNLSIGTTIESKKYVCIIGSYDGARVRLFVDGVLKNSSLYSTPITHSTNPLILSALYGTGEFASNNDSQFYLQFSYGFTTEAEALALTRFLRRFRFSKTPNFETKVTTIQDWYDRISGMSYIWQYNVGYQPSLVQSLNRSNFYYFDGVDDYFDASFNFNTGTLLFICEPYDLTNREIFSKGSYRGFRFNSGVLQFYNGSTWTDLITGLESNKLLRCAVSVDSDGMRAFVNGRAGTLQTGLTSFEMTGNCKVGANGLGGNYFKGIFHKIAYFSSRIPASQANSMLDKYVRNIKD